MDLDTFYRYIDGLRAQETGGIAERTASQYISAVEKLAAFHGEDAPEPTVEDFQDYIVSRAADDGLQGSTLNLYKCAFKKYLIATGRAGVYPQLKAWFADSFRVTSSGTPDYLRADEIEAIRAAAARLGPKENAIVTLLLRTGMRVGELTRLDVDDITFDDGSGKGYVEIEREKRGEYVKDRRRLRGWELEIVNEYMESVPRTLPVEAAEEGALFATDRPNNTDGSYRASTQHIREVITRVGEATDHENVTGERLHPHLFRHTVGSILGMAGMSATQIGAYLGKASDAERYTHFDAGAVNDMTELLDAALDPDDPDFPTGGDAVEDAVPEEALDAASP